MDMRFSAGLVVPVSKELSKYRLDLVGVQVRREDSGTQPAGEYIFYGKGNENHELGTDYFMHERIISRVKKVKFVSDRFLVSYHFSESLCHNRG
jgi:hypothetical protein